MFDYLNQFSGRRWWSLVEISGVATMLLSFIIALPCIDIFWDTRSSFGAGEVVGEIFDPQNPLRVVVFGLWTISDEGSVWIYVVALFALTFGGRVGHLMTILGDQYHRGMVCKMVRPHWLLPVRVWVQGTAPNRPRTIRNVLG